MKILKKIGNIFIWFLMAILIIILLIVGYVAFCKFVLHEKQPDIFGITSAIIVSNSMSPTLNKGDYIIVARQSEYTMGDIITYKNSSDEIITHRVIVVNGDNYETAGDVTATSDGFVNVENIYGKVVITLAGWGYFFEYLKTPIGLIFVISIALVIIVAGFVIELAKKQKK